MLKNICMQNHKKNSKNIKKKIWTLKNLLVKPRSFILTMSKHCQQPRQSSTHGYGGSAASCGPIRRLLRVLLQQPASSQATDPSNSRIPTPPLLIAVRTLQILCPWTNCWLLSTQRLSVVITTMPQLKGYPL